MGYIGPLSLNVNSDNNVAQNNRRFDLYAGDGPSDVAPVVVGVPKNWKLDRSVLGRGTVAPKIAPELLRRAEASVAKLDAAEQAGALAQGITKPLADLLRVLK
jgi:hypothetical protein